MEFAHFTSFQVRGKCARGFDLHLQRLRVAQAEVFGTALDEDAVRAAIHRALDAEGVSDASVRVSCHDAHFNFARPVEARGQTISVRVTPARTASTAPLRLKSIEFARPHAGIKHCGVFSQYMMRRAAQAEGFDDAIFIDASGHLSEGPTWSFVCVDEDLVYWPQSPGLQSVTAQLIREARAGEGARDAFADLSVASLDSRMALFAINSRGIQPIERIDHATFRTRQAAFEMLQAAWASHPLQPI